MRRGSVHWVNLEPAAPPELGKVRPGVVVSSPVYNERLDSVVVLPLSTQPPEIWPLRVQVDMVGKKNSFAIIPGLRQVSKARLHESIGQLRAPILARLSEAIALYLGE